MKIYVVGRGYPEHAFLNLEAANKYLEAVNTSPYKVDHYRIFELEPSDDMMSDFKITTDYWFSYEFFPNGRGNFYLNTREKNNLNSKSSDRESILKYSETLYHNSRTVRIYSIKGSFTTQKREDEFDEAMYSEKFRAILDQLMRDIIEQRNTQQITIEQINQQFRIEDFVIS